MNTILMDLDGTLLPMDVDIFTKAYFGALARRCASMGYNGEELVAAVWTGTKAMVANDGVISNEEKFWQSFASVLGEKVLDMKEEFEDFYRNEFYGLKEYTKPNPLAAPCMAALKEKGYRVVLATNPLFPLTGMVARLSWLGLKPEDFAHITAYENTCHCKPNPDYYRHILRVLNEEPKNCLMVGNDPKEDMCAETVGIDVFLVTDCMVNQKGADIGAYRQGSFQDFYDFVQNLPKATT